MNTPHKRPSFVAEYGRTVAPFVVLMLTVAGAHTRNPICGALNVAFGLYLLLWFDSFKNAVIEHLRSSLRKDISQSPRSIPWFLHAAGLLWRSREASYGISTRVLGVLGILVGTAQLWRYWV